MPQSACVYMIEMCSPSAIFFPAFTVIWNTLPHTIFWHCHIKGTVQQDCRPPIFHYSNLPGPCTDQWFKIYLIWLRTGCWVVKTPRQVYLPRGRIPDKSISPGYDSLASIITRQVKLVKPKIWITPRNINENRKYFNPLVSSPGRLEQGKKWRSKISLECNI